MITLVTGGCRSGKSGYALEMANSIPGQKVFCATCPRLGDEEMSDRIVRHQKEREDLTDWTTVEETIQLNEVLKSDMNSTILVDCLTLWVSNLMYEASKRDHQLTEAEVAEQTHEVMKAAKSRSGQTIFVTNETGMGIVPENALARQYRDLIGRCNQIIGAGCDKMVLMVSGQPMMVKDTTAS